MNFGQLHLVAAGLMLTRMSAVLRALQVELTQEGVAIEKVTEEGAEGEVLNAIANDLGEVFKVILETDDATMLQLVMQKTFEETPAAWN